MHDDARALFNHRWKQAAVQPDGRIQVLVDGLLPEFVGDGDESTARRR
jgi:hypothetical protein